MYLGAGDADETSLARWQPRQSSRLLLVEGDLETAAGLQRRCAGRPGVEILDQVVSADGAPVAWNRYSLPDLNGPADQSSLSRIYPRLRRLESQQLASQRLRDLVEARVAASEDGEAANALILDVPGQEEALLASLTREQLRRFCLVIVRGRQADSTSVPTALQEAGFRLSSQHCEDNPLWPVRLYRFDALRHQLAMLRKAAEEAVRREEATRHALLEAKDALEQARRRDADALAEAQARAARLDARATELEQDLAAQAAAQEQLRRQLESEHRLLAQAQSQLNELRQEHRDLRDELHRETEQAEDLRQRLADLGARADRSEGQRAAMDSELQQAKAQAQALQAKLSAADAAGWQQRCLSLEDELRVQRDERTSAARRQQLLQEELLKAEGQLEMIKSLLLAGQGL